MSQTIIEKTLFFAAPPEMVWSFLTEKEKLSQWFHMLEGEFKEGSDYQFVKQDNQGGSTPQIWSKVLTLKPPNELVYTFIIEPFNHAETTVHWVLEEAVGGTRLSLKRTGIAEAAGAQAMQLLMALDKGWDGHFSDLRECR